MSVCEQNEGAVPWRESAPLTKKEKLCSCSIPGIAKIDNLEPAQLEANAFLIHPVKGAADALWALKDELKQRGCRYSKGVQHRGWICSRTSRESIETFLRLKNVGVSFKEIKDEYQNKSNVERKSDDLWEKIDYLESFYQDEEELIIVDERNLENEINARSLREDDPTVIVKRKRLEGRRKNTLKCVPK